MGAFDNTHRKPNSIANWYRTFRRNTIRPLPSHGLYYFMHYNDAHTVVKRELGRLRLYPWAIANTSELGPSSPESKQSMIVGDPALIMRAR